MRIVFTSNTSWSLWNFRLYLMKALKDKGYEVYAIAPYDGYTKYLEKEFYCFNLKNLDRKGTNPFRELKLLAEYFVLYQKIKPLLVINFTIKPNIYSSIACGLLGIRCINVVTGLGYVFTEKRVLSWIVKDFYKFSFRFPEKVVFQNQVDCNFFIKEKIIPPKKGIIIPGSGVNIEKFSPEFCEGSLTQNNYQEKFVFLMISRLLRDKGVREFVEAGRIIKKFYPQAEFWLLGPIDEGNPTFISYSLLKKWEKEGIIRYLGVVDDVRSFICQAEVVVLPSYYREGMPKSLLEAMAMAKPIITTDAVGCREVIKDGVNGFMVKPKDIKSLATAMEKMLNLSEEERKVMGEEGRKMVREEFSNEVIVESYLGMIEELLKEKRKQKRNIL